MISGKARELHFSSLVFDTHSDSLGRIVDDKEDFGTNTLKGHMDLPRMKSGNQNAQFFAAFVDSERFTVQEAVKRANQYFDAFDNLCIKYPEILVQAKTASDVVRIRKEDKIAGILCVEGGHAIVDSLDVLNNFYSRGVRYMTLTHNMSNNWADGIQDEASNDAIIGWKKSKLIHENNGWLKYDTRHNGLTEFGRKVIKEMNKIGMIIDISHVARKTFWDVIETTNKPVMASHSSAYSITQNPRNIDDDQLKAVSKNNGVVCVNYEVTFVSNQCNQETRKIDIWKQNEIKKLESTHKIGSKTHQEYLKKINIEHNKLSAPLLKQPIYTEIIDHIDHMVNIAGIDHVGLGSDFDGSRTPTGMEDCSKIPLITQELLNRNYTDQDIRKILGLNVLRVLEDVTGS
tara:strand:+ start:5152 stop:6357 length:1206 start_codon:yes stop_codon:yes gene_type:complete